jgi:hypothetical protein
LAGRTVREVGDPLLVGCIGHELPVQQVISEDAAFAAVRREPAAPWSGPQRLHPHESLDAVQATALTQRQHVMPDAASDVGTVTTHEAVMNLTADDFVVKAALASGSAHPRIEATTRDAECLAYQQHWPGPSVLRYEAEFHIDSLAK